MQNLIFGSVSFGIALFAFVYGAVKLFKKKKPLYLQLLICAAGCFALEQLSCLINIWCDVTESFSIGMLGIFGCNFFLLSANFGTLDRIVDDGSQENARAKVLAWIAPCVTGLLAVIAFLSWKNRDMFCAVMWLLMFLPALPASYFNLKHIFLPLDPFEFLRATKPCNIAALSFYAMTALFIIFSAGNGIMGGVLSVLMSLAALGLVIAANKGAKSWGI